MAKYRVNTDGPANVPDVHLHLKPGADHQQYLPDDVDEEQLHHHDEHGPLRHQDQQVDGFTQCKVGWVRHLSIRMKLIGKPIQSTNVLNFKKFRYFTSKLKLPIPCHRVFQAKLPSSMYRSFK